MQLIGHKLWNKIYLLQGSRPVHRERNNAETVLFVQLRHYSILLLRQESLNKSYLLFPYEEETQLELCRWQRLAFQWWLLRIFSMISVRSWAPMFSHWKAISWSLYAEICACILFGGFLCFLNEGINKNSSHGIFSSWFSPLRTKKRDKGFFLSFRHQRF